MHLRLNASVAETEKKNTFSKPQNTNGYRRTEEKLEKNKVRKYLPWTEGIPSTRSYKKLEGFVYGLMLDEGSEERGKGWKVVVKLILPESLPLFSQ